MLLDQKKKYHQIGLSYEQEVEVEQEGVHAINQSIRKSAHLVLKLEFHREVLQRNARCQSIYIIRRQYNLIKETREEI